MDDSKYLNHYLIPIQSIDDDSYNNYESKGGWDNGKEIAVLVKALHFSHERFFSDKNDRDMLKLATEKNLIEEYCDGRKTLFSLAKNEKKAIHLYYYDNTGQSFLFDALAKPSDCITTN